MLSPMTHALSILTAAALLAWLPASLAHAAPSVLLEEMTWTEVRDALARGTTTILVPVGGTEQNGPHMALGKHNVRARLLAERIASRLGNALVAPVVAYVPEGAIEPPTQHMRYPGTISVSEEAFARTLEDAARSFRRHGFVDIVLIGEHGGYQGLLKRIAERLDAAWSRRAGGRPARVHYVPEYYQAAVAGHAKALRKRGYSVREIGEHAGLADTSLTLALEPRLVRKDKLTAAAAPDSGVRGEPARASAELGREAAELIVQATVDAIEKAVGAGRMQAKAQPPGSASK